MCRSLKEKYKDYYIAMYDKNDNYVYSFENIEDAANVLNIEAKEVSRKIKNDDYIRFGKTVVKLYLQPKFKINENYKRKCK